MAPNAPSAVRVERYDVNAAFTPPTSAEPTAAIARVLGLTGLLNDRVHNEFPLTTGGDLLVKAEPAERDGLFGQVGDRQGPGHPSGDPRTASHHTPQRQRRRATGERGDTGAGERERRGWERGAGRVGRREAHRGAEPAERSRVERYDVNAARAAASASPALQSLVFLGWPDC